MKKFVAISAVAAALAACGDADVEEPVVDETAMMEDDLMAGDTGMMEDDMMMGGEGMVTIDISGIQPGPGQLMVALQTEEQFAAAEGEYTQMMMADAAMETVTFEDVEPGSYAAAVVHDTNENGAIDMGETGPTEGWGLSGNVSGQPEFAAAMFTVTDMGGSADVSLTYPE